MRFRIPHDHPSLDGHFPGNPVVPGVVLLDRVVEAIEASHGPQGALQLPIAQFMHPLLPGQAAEVELADAAPGAARWRFRVLRDGQVLAVGEVVGDAPRAARP